MSEIAVIRMHCSMLWAPGVAELVGRSNCGEVYNMVRFEDSNEL